MGTPKADAKPTFLSRINHNDNDNLDATQATNVESAMGRHDEGVEPETTPVAPSTSRPSVTTTIELLHAIGRTRDQVQEPSAAPPRTVQTAQTAHTDWRLVNALRNVYETSRRRPATVVAGMGVGAILTAIGFYFLYSSLLRTTEHTVDHVDAQSLWVSRGRMLDGLWVNGTSTPNITQARDLAFTDPAHYSYQDGGAGEDSLLMQYSDPDAQYNNTVRALVHHYYSTIERTVEAGLSPTGAVVSALVTGLFVTAVMGYLFGLIAGRLE